MTDSTLDTLFGSKHAEEMREAARLDPFRPYTPPPAQEATTQLNVRIPNSLMARVKKLHKTTDEPIKSIVTRALEALCDTEER